MNEICGRAVRLWQNLVDLVHDMVEGRTLLIYLWLRQLEDLYSPHRSQSPQPALIAKVHHEAALLPAIDLGFNGNDERYMSPAAEIERPRSALHAGDFTEDSGNVQNQSTLFQKPSLVHHPGSAAHHGTSPPAPWFTATTRIPKPLPKMREPNHSQGVQIDATKGSVRIRAPSLQSFSSSYVLKAPTSPLVQQSNNDDLDFSPIELSDSPSRSNRRHTFTPQSLQSLSTRSEVSQPSSLHQPGLHHSEGLSAYQSHQPRRSLTFNWSFQPNSSPQTPAFLRSRGPSFSSEASPLQHASMVGSYEESILRGRMSTGPSKPLDFTAQIGVLGKGDHKPKYPPHVTIPFPAVFYSWNNGVGSSPSAIDDEPSPYVGHIDLEHSLPPQVEKETHHRKTKTPPRLENDDLEGDLDNTSTHQNSAINLALRNKVKRKRRSTSPKAPLGGSYRIPQQGQLQIMIKNPNKTAVKLFLVPYDLSGMESGTKTFIRQRCYSAGPIIETPLTSKPATEAGMIGAGDTTKANNRPSLRYLIHLNICCPSKGRYYLYQHVRVVFANRVPDNKEKLQNDIQLPEPRYSVYKANRDFLPAVSAAGTKLTAEKAQRRRSYGFGMPSDVADFGVVPSSNPRASSGGRSHSAQYTSAAPPVPPIPSGLDWPKPQPKAEDLMGQSDQSDLMEIDSSQPTTASSLQSPLSEKTSVLANTLSGSHRNGSSGGSDSYGKLSKGDVGYGGVFGRPGTPEPGEGLLARKLRSLGMEKGGKNSDEFT
jgi:hypothetical protein